MPTVPYVRADIREPTDIVGAIRARRAGALLNLDRMLLHSPHFARGWNSLLGATRSELSLEPRLRELCICAVGMLNGAEYEVHQHKGPLLAAGGSVAQLEAMRLALANAPGDDAPLGAATLDNALFSAGERAALRVACAMTRNVQVDAPLLEQARALLGSDALLVELVGLIATYNMVSRFLVALDVGIE